MLRQLLKRKTVMRSFVWGWCVALTLLVAGPAQAQREVANAPDPWVHAATGAKLPVSVAGFQRTRVSEYSDDGRDASASYVLRREGGFVSVTLYIYPAAAGLTCVQTFADGQAQIVRRGGVRLIREARDLPPSGRGTPVAHYARYAIPAGTMGEGIPALTSDLYLHCPAGSGFLVKYRASGTEGFEFGPDVTRLIRSIAWPAALAD
ncbi:MAG: hypothetical protein B7Y97_12305 [Sphingomonas sp. 32-66-10]|nr:MAG: hypothetical protein B7Y97_12305 [Sphingomonas sp. 32-66-10]